MWKRLKENVWILALIGGIGVYVVVMGRSGACRACSAVTDLVGLSGGNQATVAGTREAEKGDWSVRSLEGEEIRFSDLRGKVVLLDVWATWCPPCRKGIPEFIELQTEFAERGLVVIGLSVDQAGPEVVREFSERMGINYPVAMATSSVLKSLGPIEGIPTTFLYDREGNLRQRMVGYQPKAAFAEVLDPLLD